jgi:hypothetical protein
LLQPVQIFACDESGNQDNSKSFTLQVNPSTINIDHKNQYSSESGMGSIGSDQKFNKTEPATFSFKTILDGTGVIRPVRIDVKAMIDAVKDICYNYHGDKHEPNKIIIIWGTLLFKGILTKLNVTYKLFSAEGNLLRAELDISFGEYKDKTEECKEKNQQSPDITHIKEFKAGDRLPIMCKEIYKNSKLYFEIARINNITDYRNISIGTRLIFPPIK